MMWWWQQLNVYNLFICQCNHTKTGSPCHYIAAT